MKTLLILSLLTMISCGKNTTTTIENKFNDGEIKATLIIQDARIAALEAKLEGLGNNLDNLVVSFNNGLNSLENDLLSNDEKLDQAIDNLTELQSKPNLSVIKICNTNEYLIKDGRELYAVYMVSNNYGTFLGKLSENLEYQTTDSFKARFKIINNSIICL